MGDNDVCECGCAAGNVGRDPEKRMTKKETPVANFPLAVDTYAGKDEAKEEPMWVTIVAWGKLAETVGKLVKKGSSVLVSGELQIRKYTDKNDTERRSVEVRADRVKLLDSKAKLERDLAA